MQKIKINYYNGKTVVLPKSDKFLIGLGIIFILYELSIVADLLWR